jgi:hypothetical protein
MTPGHYVGEGGIQEVSVSDDGVHWSTVRPAGAENVGIYLMEQFGSKLIAFGQLQGGDITSMALTTTDGRHWKSAAFPGHPNDGTAVYRIACGNAACVAVGSTSPAGIERPAMWRTTNGLDWQPIATEITGARHDGSLSAIVTTPSGFVAVGASDPEVLISRDGATWQNVTVLRRQDLGGLQQVAVIGDVLFGLGFDAGGENAQWLGNLGELPFP